MGDRQGKIADMAIPVLNPHPPGGLPTGSSLQMDQVSGDIFSFLCELCALCGYKSCFETAEAQSSQRKEKDLRCRNKGAENLFCLVGLRHRLAR